MQKWYCPQCELIDYCTECIYGKQSCKKGKKLRPQVEFIKYPTKDHKTPPHS